MRGSCHFVRVGHRAAYPFVVRTCQAAYGTELIIGLIILTALRYLPLMISAARIDFCFATLLIMASWVEIAICLIPGLGL